MSSSIQIALQAAQHSWLLPQQVYDLLTNYSNYGFKLSTTRPASPPSTGLYLYDKKIVPNWAEDGGQWNLLKNGFIPISHNVLIGYMWHEYGAILRRVYWLASSENVVLAHYLARSSSGFETPQLPQLALDLTPLKTKTDPPVPSKQESSFEFQSSFLSSMQMMQCLKQGFEDSQLRPLPSLSSPPVTPPAPTPAKPVKVMGLGGSIPSPVLDGMSPDDLKKLILANKESRTRGGSGLDYGAFLPQLPSFQNSNFSSLLSGSQMNIPSMPVGMDFFSPAFSSQQQQPQPQPQPSLPGMTSSLGRLGLNFLMSNTSTPSPTAASPRNTPSTPAPVTPPLSPEDTEIEPVGRGRRGKKGDAGEGRSMDKMQRIRARKAEVARACRIRKKAYIRSLEEKTARLTARLMEVETRLQESEARNAAYREEQKNLLERLSAAGKSTSTDMDLPSSGLLCTKIEGETKMDEAKRLIEQMIVHTKRPHAVVAKHLAGLEESFVPVDHVKFLLWSCTQSDDFYVKSGWKTLIHQELALNEKQVQSFMEMKPSVQHLKKDAFDIQVKVKQLSEEIKHHLSGRERGVQDLLALLSPTQAARLAVWVDQHAKTMEISSSPALTGPSFLTVPPPLSIGVLLPTDDLDCASEDDQMNLFPEVPTPRLKSGSPLNPWSSPFTSSPFTSSSFSFTSGGTGDSFDRDLFAP